MAIRLEGFETGFLADIVFALLPVVTGKAVDDEAVRRSRLDRDGEAAIFRGMAWAWGENLIAPGFTPERPR
jgi:hypothetical protein